MYILDHSKTKFGINLPTYDTLYYKEQSISDKPQNPQC